jgi:hypothetical protein
MRNCLLLLPLMCLARPGATRLSGWLPRTSIHEATGSWDIYVYA